MKRIAAAWEIFEAACIPAAAGDTQRKSMKMAFYGGASSLLAEIMKMLDPGSEPIAADLAAMSAIERELRDFAAEGVTKRRPN